MSDQHTDITWCAHENLKVSNSFFSCTPGCVFQFQFQLLIVPVSRCWDQCCTYRVQPGYIYSSRISWVLVSKNILVRYDLKQYLPYTSKSLNPKPWNPSIGPVIYQVSTCLYKYQYQVLCLPHTRQKSASDLLTTSNRLVWQFCKVPNTSTCQAWKEKQKTTHTMTSLVCPKVHNTSTLVQTPDWKTRAEHPCETYWRKGCSSHPCCQGGNYCFI